MFGFARLVVVAGALVGMAGCASTSAGSGEALAAAEHSRSPLRVEPPPSPAQAHPATDRAGPATVPAGTVLYVNREPGGTVATCDVNRCFDAISSYRKIQEDRVPENTARYHFLLIAANQTFSAAVESVAERQEIDVVVEAGNAMPADAAVDVTDDVIRRIVAE